MAITNYLKRCEYRIGGLKPHIYLIHKNSLTVKIKAKGIEVSFSNRSDGTSQIYKLEGALNVYSQEETYESKYRFNSTLEFTINELYKEPFFYGLKTLRTNQYYIIIEDKKGIQYLVNPELYTSLNYEYVFTDTKDGDNAVTLTWFNLSNFPLLIFNEKVDSDVYLLKEQCNYNMGRAFELIMCSHKQLKVNDDGVKISNLYVDDVSELKRIEYMQESFTLSETYDGNMFRTTLSYSIPLDDHQFEFSYNLLEFKDNKYTAILRTTNDNYIVAGIENGLFPSYNIETSDDDSNPNKVNISFTQLSQYPILFTDDITQYRWIPTDEICFGYDKYQMLTQEYSEDWGETWNVTEPEVKKKGDLIEASSEDCKLYQWVDDGTFCYLDSVDYIKWVAVDNDFICENGNKYEKLKKYISNNNISYTPIEEYIKGELIEENSEVCQSIAIRWVDENDYLCFEVNEDLTQWIETDEYCDGYNKYRAELEKITSNGTIYYESGEQRNSLIEEDCCECGYREYDYRISTPLETECGANGISTTKYEKWYKWEYCPDDVSYDKITEEYKWEINEEECCECGYRLYDWVNTNRTICGKDLDIAPILTIKSYSGNWSVDGNTFTSNDINNNEITIQRIYFTLRNGNELVFNIDQSSETGYDYLVISNLDKAVVSGSPSTTGSSYNFYNHKNKTTGTTSMTIPNADEHFIELMYRKDSSQSSGRDNVIVTLGVGGDIVIEETSAYEVWEKYEYCPTDESYYKLLGEYDYRNPQPSCECGNYAYDYIFNNEYACGSEINLDPVSKYEVWREYELCSNIPTGNIEYRNPQKSYDCGYVTYQWREEEVTCGNALPTNTTEVKNEPELNKDFE